VSRCIQKAVEGGFQSVRNIAYFVRKAICKKIRTGFKGFI
jgi:hypothetical protein